MMGRLLDSQAIFQLPPCPLFLLHVIEGVCACHLLISEESDDRVDIMEQLVRLAPFLRIWRLEGLPRHVDAASVWREHRLLGALVDVSCKQAGVNRACVVVGSRLLVVVDEG